MNAIEKVQKLREELESNIVERDNEIEGALAAIIAGAHVLLLGPPGTAKSLMANNLCQAIKGGAFFQWLLTKFSTPEELFGQYSLKGLENDEYRRITKGKLPEATIAFLDEIFKANSAILNSLLTLINERKFHNNGGSSDVPLISCFAASNELPQGEELGALYDRFVLRYWVSPIRNEGNFKALMNGAVGGNAPTVELTVEEIKELQKALDNITVPTEVLDALYAVHEELKAKGINASDRRWKTAVHILKAFAMLRGQTEVTTDELECLADMMWHNPDDRKTILQVVSPKANPLNLRAIEYLDEAREVYEQFQNNKKDTQVLMQVGNQLKEILERVEADLSVADKSKTKKLEKARDEIKGYKNDVVAAAFA